MKEAKWMGLYRFMYMCHQKHIPLLPSICKAVIRIIFCCVIPPSCKIGEGCSFPHGGLGVILHENCIIGKGCKIQSHVVIGGRNGNPKVPRIGDYVLIGTGAKILGDVTIGDHAAIGAGAVVVHNVQPYTVVVGVTAKETRCIGSEDSVM